MTDNKLLEIAKDYAVSYLNGLPERRVFPTKETQGKLSTLSFSLPQKPVDPAEVIQLLHETGSDNTVATTGARYFGFVFGGTLPAALAASWLAATWDQNAVFKISSPIGVHLEKVAGAWLLNLLRLPEGSATGFVTGTTMANFCGILAARHCIYQRKGWDSRKMGLRGAPKLRIIAGEEIHASMLRALMLAGIGTDDLIKVPADGEGRIIASAMPELDDTTLICLQAGNVNTGAIDPIETICRMAHGTGAWVHVDGAFGLWARVSALKNEMTSGCELADSWAIDLHKWLNVPYDSGVIICKDPKLLQEALSVSAAYLPDSAHPDPYNYTPEMSRRARGIEAWAAMLSLGVQGVTDLIERCCRYAALFAANLQNAGFEILNEVMLNQVLVSFGNAAQTKKIIMMIQEDGTCWCGGTVWHGITAMRISVSSWMTTADDVELCSAAIIRIAQSVLQEDETI